MAVTLCLSCSLMLNRRSRSHSAGWWLSLRHLISIFSGPQLIKAQRPLRPDVAFLTTSRLQLAGTPTGNSTRPLGVELNWNRNSIPLARRTQLSYIRVQRPVDLWNRMFYRHQAEITGSSSHYISQFPPTRFPLLTAIGMCHFLRCITLNGILSRVKRSKYNISLEGKLISNQFYSSCVSSCTWERD